jgi:hypothetical protein
MCRVWFVNSQNMLLNVLRGYAIYDRRVGYSQGMSYIVALLMLHIPDEQLVFWCFVRYAFKASLHLLTITTYRLYLVID